MKLPQRFSAFEVALLLIFAVIATRALVRQHDLRYGGASLVEPPLVEELERRFGPRRHSMGLEEWFVLDFFDNARGGIFVDVGAWEPIKGSNTYRLENDLGWSGLAIDALEDLSPAYAAARPRTRFVAAFVTDTDSGESVLHVPSGLTEVASGSESFVRIFATPGTPRRVRNRTLDRILSETGVSRIDFLSMDIELGEPTALAAFSIRRYRPRLVCVEAHGATRQQILDYFARHGYVLLGRYLPYDRVNLYFAPIENPESPHPTTSGHQ
jgi:hypothetical protein